MNREYITIVGFDIGEKNFCFFIDRYPIKDLQRVKLLAIPYGERYDKNGECTQKFGGFLKQLAICGERIYTEKFDMTSKGDKKSGKRRIITTAILVRLTNYLDCLNEKGIFDQVDYFLIEEQLKRAENNRQIQFHLRSYLIGLFLDFRPIIIFPSYYKTRVLGAPKKIHNEKTGKYIKMKHGDRKKWAVEKAREILSDREDNQGLELFSKKAFGKCDDISDCVLEILAFINLVFIDNKKEIVYNG